MLRTLSLLALAGLLAACQTTVSTDRARIETDSVTVEVGDNPRGEGRFCPPGHAKKGWC